MLFGYVFLFSDAPTFHDKPHIVQRDNGNIIVIKVRAKSELEMKAEWFKVSFGWLQYDLTNLHSKPSNKDRRYTRSYSLIESDEGVHQG